MLRALLRVTPHTAAERHEDGVLVWADARGLPARRVARGVRRAARAVFGEACGGALRLGVARVPVAAEVAARHGGASPDAPPVVLVASRHERAFLAERPLAALAHTPAWSRRLAAALADVGLERCGELAALPLAAVEVRFGAAGAALWRLARADDPRRIFAPAPRAHPAASVEWSEFAVRDAERLLFFCNGLAGRVCADLRARGQAARALTLRLALAGGGAVEHPVRAARAHASRAAWLRLLRQLLERVRLPDAACGLLLRVDAAHAADAPQGDLFDAGFQTGGAAEEAVARLLEDGEAAPVRLTASEHALPERRLAWRAAAPDDVLRTLRASRAPARAPAPAATPRALPARVAERPPAYAGPRRDGGRRDNAVADLAAARAVRAARLDGARSEGAPADVAEGGEPLALRVLAAPVQLAEVGTRRRRGAGAPVWLRGPDAARVDVVAAAGPDRVAAGGAEPEGAAAREYWQCATDDGRLLLLYRDARDGAWYVHGAWD